MTGIRVSSVSEQTFNASAARNGLDVDVVMTGTADMKIKDQLDAFLSDLHQAVTKTRANVVTVDMKQLEFMNSSCFKSLLIWVGYIQALDPAHQYRIKILSDSGKYWQRRSFHALKCFASELIEVEG